MNLKDIEVGKCYSYAIWGDEEPIFFKCTNKDEDCFTMQECPPYGWDEIEQDVGIWEFANIDCEDSFLEEIPEMRYVIHQMGLLIEEHIVQKVIDIKKNQ